jgi:hypothetical protein
MKGMIKLIEQLANKLEFIQKINEPRLNKLGLVISLSSACLQNKIK